MAASGNPDRRASASVMRRRVDHLDRVDLDHLPADDPVPGAVAVAGHDLAALPPPEGDGDDAVDDQRPEPGLEQHPDEATAAGDSCARTQISGRWHWLARQQERGAEAAEAMTASTIMAAA